MSPRKKIVDSIGSNSSHLPSVPSHDAIALRAYEFFLQRGCTHGWDVEDWLQAERELLANGLKKPARGKKAALAEAPLH